MIYNALISFGLLEGSIGTMSSAVMGLAIQLEKEGQKKPFVVYVNKHKQFKLVSGDTRYQAYKYVLKKSYNFKVPCILISEVTLPYKKITSYKELKKYLGNHLDIGITVARDGKKLNIFTGINGHWHSSGRILRTLNDY